MAKKTIQKVNPLNGKIEFYDEETGELLFVQSDSIRKLNSPSKRVRESSAVRVPKWVWKKNKNGVPVMVPSNGDAYDVPDDFQAFVADKEAWLNIATLISDGNTITDIAKMEGMPPRYIIFNWYLKNDSFKELVDEARRIRADSYHDKLAKLAKTVKNDTARADKVKADIYKHLMAVNDRDRFGSQTKVVGDPDAPISFVVETGIRKAVAETREIIDVTPDKASESGDRNGLCTQATPAGDPPGLEEVQCPSDPPPVREDGSMH